MKVVIYGRSDSSAKVIFDKILGPIEPLDKCVSISFDHNPDEEIPRADYKVLLLWEPSVVMPWQYKNENRQRFDLVIPMSYWRALELGYEEYSFQEYVPPGYRISPWQFRTKRIVMINSAKFSASTKSNYGLRRKVSKALFESGVAYELYGDNWKESFLTSFRKRVSAIRNALRAGESISLCETFSEMLYKFPEHRGSISRKEAILGDSELSLVIENQSDTVTEKLFDSIFAGAVPVYVGPDLKTQFPYLEQCVVRAEPSVEKILERIKNLTDMELDSKRKALEKFLNQKGESGIGFWDPINVWSKAAEIIQKRVIALF